MKGWLDKYQNGSKLLDINSPKLPPTFNPLTGETNSEVSSSYTFDDGTYLLPTFKYGRFLENPEAEYMKTGEFLGGPFKTVEEAEAYREARHNFIDQGKQSIIPLRTRSYKDGGEINYNDFSVSAPEGWVGDGYSNVGRNYSPAWGGQFAMGGSLPGASGMMYNRSATTYSDEPSDMLQDGGAIPNEIFLRQAYRESLFNPKAKSGKGAKGLVQLKPEAIEDYARANKVDVKSIDPYNVEDAMKVQDWFMNHYIDSDLVKNYAKTPEDAIGITLGIYNYGYGNMRSNLRENKGYKISKLPKETRNYINQIQLGKDQQFEQDYQTALKNNPHIQKLYIPEEITPIIPDVETPGWLDNMITTGKGVYKAAKETLGKFPLTFQDGGVIEDDLGQWAHPGKITKIGSNQITMRDVPYPVLGISDTGDTKMMYPEQDYTFIGDSVTEIPMAQKGIRIAQADATRTSKTPIILEKDYLKKQAEANKTFLSPYDSSKKLSPKETKARLEKYESDKNKREIANTIRDKAAALEILALIPTPITETISGIAGITNFLTSSYLAGQDIKAGNNLGAAMNLVSGAFGVSSAPLVGKNLPNIISNIKDAENIKSGLSSLVTGKSPKVYRVDDLKYEEMKGMDDDPRWALYEISDDDLHKSWADDINYKLGKIKYNPSNYTPSKVGSILFRHPETYGAKIEDKIYGFKKINTLDIDQVMHSLFKSDGETKEAQKRYLLDELKQMNNRLNNSERPYMTGSLNTSSNSWILQPSRMFDKKYKGLTTYIGDAPMNNFGYLEGQGYSKREIQGYLNRRLDEQIASGRIPKDIKRPYFNDETSTLMVPNYVVKNKNMEANLLRRQEELNNSLRERGRQVMDPLGRPITTNVPHVHDDIITREELERIAEHAERDRFEAEMAEMVERYSRGLEDGEYYNPFFPEDAFKQGGELTKLDQLTNFTNYNTKQPGGWLDKYEG